MAADDPEILPHTQAAAVNVEMQIRCTHGITWGDLLDLKIRHRRHHRRCFGGDLSPQCTLTKTDNRLEIREI